MIRRTPLLFKTSKNMGAWRFLFPFGRLLALIMLFMLERTISIYPPALLLGLTCFVGVFACADITPTQVCPVPTELNYSDVMPRRLEGVDLLFVVDNSMPDRFPDLVTRMAQMVNSLVNPLPGWQWPSASPCYL